MEKTPEILRDLYLVQMKTETEIAALFGVSQVQVGRLRKKWGIPTLGKTGRQENSLPASLTPEQDSIMIGSMLGNGYLQAVSARTAVYAESHGPKQFAYLEWKAGMFGPFLQNIFPTMKRVGDKEFPGKKFALRSCTVLRPYYDLFYPNASHRKIFPADLFERLTPLALAVWYMDSGSLGSPHTARINFGLDAVSLERALQALRKLGFKPVAYGEKGDRSIWLTGGTRLFLDLVGDVVSEHTPEKLPVWTERQAGDSNAKALTPELAASLYQEGSTLEEIAEQYGIGVSTVRRRLDTAGVQSRAPGPCVERRSALQAPAPLPALSDVLPLVPTQGTNKPKQQWAKKLGLTPETLRDLYTKYTDEEIGKIFGVSGVAVGVQRGRWGIGSISLRQRKDQGGRKGLPSLDDLTPEELTSLSKNMGDRKIAGIYGVQKPAVSRLREQWGIEATSKSERATCETPLTEEQKETLIGTLLGDAHLLERGVLQISHSHDQIGYLKEVHGILFPYAKPIHFSESSMPSGQVCFTFGFATVQHVWLRELRKVFYPEGIKVFPESIIRNLTPRSLAYWYFDDGHWGDQASIALGAVSREEAENVSKWLQEHFGFETRLKGVPRCRSLFVTRNSIEIFFNLIRNYAIPDMLYKFPLKYRPAGIRPIYPVRTTPQVKLPPDLLEGCSDWADKTPAQQEQTIEDLRGFWRSHGFPHCEIRPEELITLLEVTPDQVIHEGMIRSRSVGQSLCHSFMQHIWKARSRGNDPSPFDLFSEDSTLKGVLRYLLDKGSKPTAAGLRSALRYWKHSGVSNFRPSAAKALVDTYCVPGGVVWDPCAGYGGRLLGALLSRNAPRYIACEPQPETFHRLQELTDWIEKYLPGTTPKVQLNQIPAEEFKLPEFVDMVFTSPPYWQQEVYGEEETQAGVRYQTYEAWLEGFWKPVLRQATEKLKAGGWLVVNVDTFTADHRNYDLPSDTVAICKALGFGKDPEILLYALNGANYESVLCWKREGSVQEVLPVSPDSNRVIVSRCGKCGALVPIGGIKDGDCPECRAATGTWVSCKGCGVSFLAPRKDQEFCDPNCYARWRRKEFRKLHPAKTTRTFTCSICGKKWESAELGSPNKCSECREAREIESRTKTCQYRHCGRTFVDESAKNGMSYCHEEHRRREKLFRFGEVTDLSQFRKPDPVLGNSKPVEASPVSGILEMFGVPVANPRLDYDI